MKCKENDNLFLLYESRVLFRIVPKRAFEKDEELAAFTEKAKAISS